MYKCFKRLHTCKIESSILCHLNLGVLQPHTGKSSQKTKDVTHPNKSLEDASARIPQPQNKQKDFKKRILY